jgi:hypothetical protein
VKTFRDFTDVHKKKLASTELLNSSRADVQYSLVHKNNQQTSLVMLQKVVLLQAQIDRAEDRPHLNVGQSSHAWKFATKMLIELYVEYEKQSKADDLATATGNVLQTPMNNRGASEFRDGEGLGGLGSSRGLEQTSRNDQFPSSVQRVSWADRIGGSDRGASSEHGVSVEREDSRGDQGQSSVQRGSWSGAEREDSRGDQGQSSVQRDRQCGSTNVPFASTTATSRGT